VQQGLVSADQPVAMFLNMTQLSQAVASAKSAFSSNFVHAFAAKANPLIAVLRHLRAAGMGCEAASLGELCQALRAGFPPDRIVFDSPAKTMGELRFALSQGVNLNIDNMQELDRVTTVRVEDGIETPQGNKSD
jgi:diaminopimelate decarboxylase